MSCNALHPTLEELAVEFEGKAVVTKINVDKNPELSAQFEITSIPALFYFKDGVLAGKQKGVQPKKILSQNLNNLLKN
jgi:thioredoxin 1